MTAPATPRDDAERDAWLSAALRHAPDADAAAPADLSAAILRQARNAVKTPVVTPRPNPLMQAWSWLARPPIAAGFATVMVAVLVSTMWWDKPLDEAVPARPATMAEREVAAPTPEPPKADAPREKKSVAPASAAKRERAAERDTADRRAATNAAPARMAEAAPRPQQAPAAVPAPAPAPAAAPVLSTAPPPAPEAEARAGAAATRDEAAAARNAQGKVRADALAKSAPAPAAAMALRRATDAAVLATPTIDQPDRWTWQRGAGPQAMTPALQRWLVQLDGAARWRPADTAPPAGALTLRLWRDGAPHATIQLGPEAAWLTPAGGPALSAPLSPASALALQTALIDATP